MFNVSFGKQCIKFGSQHEIDTLFLIQAAIITPLDD